MSTLYRCADKIVLLCPAYRIPTNHITIAHCSLLVYCDHSCQRGVFLEDKHWGFLCSLIPACFVPCFFFELNNYRTLATYACKNLAQVPDSGTGEEFLQSYPNLRCAYLPIAYALHAGLRGSFSFRFHPAPLTFSLS